MKAGLVVSIIGHVGAVLMTLLAWEARSSLPSVGVAVVPIEIVDVSDETNVRALAMDVPDEEEATTEETEVTAREEVAPTPASAPGPRRPPPREQQDEWDPSDASAFINRERERQRREDGETSDRNQRGVGRGTAETATLEARIASLSSQILNRCWRSVADMPDPDRLRVVIAIRLNRDGSLNGQPRVVSPTNYTFDPLMSEAVNRALRAVRTCDPMTRLPEDPIVGEAYDLWREQEVEFRVRQ